MRFVEKLKNKLFERRKRAKRKKLGRIVANVEIVLCNIKDSIGDSRLSRVFKTEELGQNAVDIAKKLLGGFWQLTEKGYLIKGKNEKVPGYSEALLYVEENIGSLFALADIIDGGVGNECYREILEKGLENIAGFPLVHFHWMGEIGHFGLDKSGFYIVEIKEDYQYNAR